VTAAHCLPFFPPCHGASYLEERTYKNLLAPLGSKPAVWAECLFADPIADIAVLGAPDNQELSGEAAAFEALVEGVTPLAIGEAPEKGSAWLLSLDGQWFGCTAEYLNDGPLYICNTAQPIAGGMSGSPVVLNDGTAIGGVSLGTEDRCEDQYGCSNPRLARDLPGWVLRAANCGVGQKTTGRSNAPQRRLASPGPIVA
jgi:hypothetical protein